MLFARQQAIVAATATIALMSVLMVVFILAMQDEVVDDLIFAVFPTSRTCSRRRIGRRSCDSRPARRLLQRRRRTTTRMGSCTHELISSTPLETVYHAGLAGVDGGVGLMADTGPRLRAARWT